jgi:DNA-binding response OmpR family regulator
MTVPPEPPLAGPAPALVPERSAVCVAGREVALTPTQFRLLAMLLVEPGRAFSRVELVEGAIGARVTPRTVDVHVRGLRRRLGPDGRCIEAVPWVGYRYRPTPDA